MPSTCTGPSCRRPAFARGLCEPHYRRELRAEKGRRVRPGPVRERGSPLVRVHTSVEPDVAARLGDDSAAMAREILTEWARR
jgi:hypothetical protein